MKKKNLLLTLILVIAFAFGLTQCTTTNGPTPGSSFMVKLSNSTALGKYLTDKDGYALYMFSNDANGANNCTGGCTAAWVIFNASGLTQAQLGSGLLLSDFSTITTPGGTQTTYKGWPLYYYAPNSYRETAGTTAGDGVDGVWFVAKPTYTLMLANYQLVGLDGVNYVASANDVTSAGTGLTTYFTDLAGRTLYIHAKDSANINKFTKTDFSNNASWPIYVTTKLDFPSAIDKSLFDSITVSGHKQLTYKGWPMFYYGGDVDGTGKFRGYAKGVSVPTPNTWKAFIIGVPPAP